MMNVRKYSILALLVVALGAGIAAYNFWGARYQLVITEEQLLTKLNEKFPFNKTFFLVINLHLSNPRLSLENGTDRISFGCDVETKLKVEVDSEKGSGPLRGAALISGKVRYEPSEGAFYLDEPIVESLDIAGIPDKWRGKVNEALARAAGQFLKRAPIYKLRPTDIKKAAARLILRDVEVRDKQLIVTMGVG